MTYVLDSNSFIVLGHYFPSRFPTFWQQFNSLVGDGRVISVREVQRELDNQIAKPHLRDWIDENKGMFLPPTPEETQFVSEILANQHFQQLVNLKLRLSGGPAADPFVIASARVRSACVVTEEQFKPHAARIPNVCKHYGIDCIPLEEMMENENWSF